MNILKIAVDKVKLMPVYKAGTEIQYALDPYMYDIIAFRFLVTDEKTAVTEYMTFLYDHKEDDFEQVEYDMESVNAPDFIIY